MTNDALQFVLVSLLVYGNESLPDLSSAGSSTHINPSVYYRGLLSDDRWI